MARRGKNPRKRHPREKNQRRKKKQRNAIITRMTTVPGSSMNPTMRRKGRIVNTRDRTFVIGMEAVDERSKEGIAIAGERGFGSDEQWSCRVNECNSRVSAGFGVT